MKPVTPLLTVDAVIFSYKGLLLIRRKDEPFKGQYALPGGFVEVGETVEAACVRELREETGLSILKSQLKMVGIFSEPDRDPRGHAVSAAFWCRLPVRALIELKAGDDAATAEWVRDYEHLQLAFDHNKIIEKAGR